MGKYISARVALAGVAAITLAGCGSAASTSGAASGGSPAASTSATASATTSAEATASPSGAAGAVASAPFPVAVGNTWIYQAVTSIHNAHSTVTVQGGGTESVSVPAGTYQATVVNMTIVTHVGSFATTITVKEWTAPGTGPVKSEELIKAAGQTQTTSTEALLSFTKG